MPAAVLRVARPTDRLDAVVRFYRDGLGLSVLARFADHHGFDGAVLGAPHSPYHLEFTHERGHAVGRAPSKDHLLVFYLPERAAWEEALRRLAAIGASPVPSYNPYWDRRGATFEDPDGYRIVLHNVAWER